MAALTKVVRNVDAVGRHSLTELFSGLMRLGFTYVEDNAIVVDGERFGSTIDLNVQLIIINDNIQLYITLNS